MNTMISVTIGGVTMSRVLNTLALKELMPQAAGIVPATEEEPPVKLGSNPRSKPVNVHECVFASLRGLLANNAFDIQQDRDRLCDEAILYAVTIVEKLDRL